MPHIHPKFHMFVSIVLIVLYESIFNLCHQSFYFSQCLKFKTDQAQDAKKMEKLNNIFFTLMARGPEVDNGMRRYSLHVHALPFCSNNQSSLFLSLHLIYHTVDISEVTGKEAMEVQPAKKGRGRKQ
ncbi:Signal recognition particle 9 kDa protein [Vitis vinifera]|uniref:Signal recognition particle 9 kDa protein n=1 Tax=Vitis vinifera TaxID=29760 RepID=A0A438KGX3_VITVI|nr:Signal recognition particle 9 kDa protein [Vitis vinifera]